MVHSTSIIPGLSNFLDNVVLSQFSPTSPKRIIGAGVLSLALKNADTTLQSLLQNPMVIGLGITTTNNLVDIDTLRVILKEQITKAGIMRITVPLLGNIDFTPEDVDSLYRYISSAQPVIKEEVT